MAHRAAPSAERVLVVRPDPIRRAIVLGFFATVSMLFGVPSLLFGKTEGSGDRSVPIVFGGLFTIVGAVSAWFSYAAAATRLHLALDASALDLRWTRFGRVVRHERVAREDLLDVAVHDTPMSGPDAHDVVIGTRNGDIALGRGHQGALGYYLRRRDEIARFLSVPARPR